MGKRTPSSEKMRAAQSYTNEMSFGFALQIRPFSQGFHPASASVQDPHRHVCQSKSWPSSQHMPYHPKYVLAALAYDCTSGRDASAVRPYKPSLGSWDRRGNLPNRINPAEKAATATGYPDSRMMAYTTGTVMAPMMAQKLRMPT